MDLSAIKPLQGRLEEHPVYAKVQDLSGLRVFMQTSCVFGVGLHEPAQVTATGTGTG